MVNSRLGLFTAACFRRHPFSRSYGVILPSSLTIVLSLALGFSPHLPVSVCGTGTYSLISGFSWQCEIDSFGTIFPPRHTSCFSPGGFAYPIHSVLGHALPTACSVYPPASPLHSNDFRWYRNLNLLSIAYSFRSRLRSRLTLSGRTFLRKPQIFGGQDSHLPLATHANILSPIQSTETHISASARIRCSSTIPYGYPKLRW